MQLPLWLIEVLFVEIVGLKGIDVYLKSIYSHGGPEGYIWCFVVFGSTAPSTLTLSYPIA